MAKSRSQGSQPETVEGGPPGQFYLLKATQQICAMSSIPALQGRGCFSNADKSMELACLVLWGARPLAFGEDTYGDLSKSQICKHREV